MVEPTESEPISELDRFCDTLIMIKQEIEKILPRMLELVDDFPGYQFVIAATNTFSKAYYHVACTQDTSHLNHLN